MKKTYTLIAFSIVLYSCNPVPEVVNDNYVIEAYLFSKEPVREVTIKTMVPLSDRSEEHHV